jgi:hypothetical protein
MVDKAALRHSSAEVKAAADAKQAAKEVKLLAMKASINRAAEFESVAVAYEDVLDVTPRPTFTRKKTTLSTELVPKTDASAETSDFEMTNRLGPDGGSYVPPENSVTADDSTLSEGSIEETPMPLSRKKKRAAQKVAAKSTTKVANHSSFTNVASMPIDQPDDLNIELRTAIESDTAAPPPLKQTQPKKTADIPKELESNKAGKKKKKRSVHDAIEAVQDQMTSSAMDIDADAEGPRDVKAKSKAADKGKVQAVGLGLGEKSGEVNFTIDWKPKGTVKDKGKEQ